MKKSLGAKTIAFPSPVFIVGSYDKDGKPNAMNVAWGGICSSAPPCISVSLRKARKTYDNILENKAFTINIPSESYIKEADYFGIVSGKNVDKFVATGLTPVKSDLVEAPYIKEFPVIIECKLFSTLELGIHTQFIGEIIDVKIDESALNEKDLPILDIIKPILYATEIKEYYSFGQSVGKAFSIGKDI